MTKRPLEWLFWGCNAQHQTLLQTSLPPLKFLLTHSPASFYSRRWLFWEVSLQRTDRIVHIGSEWVLIIQMAEASGECVGGCGEKEAEPVAYTATGGGGRRQATHSSPPHTAHANSLKITGWHKYRSARPYVCECVIGSWGMGNCAIRLGAPQSYFYNPPSVQPAAHDYFILHEPPWRVIGFCVRTRRPFFMCALCIL